MSSQASDIRAAIEQANKEFAHVFARGDAAGMARLYTETGTVMSTNSDFVVGRKALQEFWQGAIDGGVKTVRLETVEVEQFGATANEMGQYSLIGPDDQILDRGKYIVIWKEKVGRWKIHRDIWNTSLPAE